jgi:hypothetical protein
MAGMPALAQVGNDKFGDGWVIIDDEELKGIASK